MKAVLIAGTQSGSGKTLATLGLLAAAKRRGLQVRGFKVGPDFIDPGHHLAVTGRTSHNLDGWMLDKPTVRALFARNSQDMDLAVVEGVMGVFDGASGRNEAGSSAEMAKWLDIPAILVINTRSMARSVAAVAKGFALFDPPLRMAGMLCNNVGSQRHERLLQEALESVPDIPLLGCLARTPQLQTPSRHLGLVLADELNWENGRLDALADWFEAALPVDKLLQALPETFSDNPPDPPLPPADVRIAVARDAAFCFYYEENLHLLRQAGAEPVFFSPVQDQELPKGVSGIYLGGGYPELHAARLSANTSLLTSLRKFSQAGGPIYAECGGLMYLCESIEDKQGGRFPMCGIFAMTSTIRKTGMTLGYRDIAFTKNTLLGEPGSHIRGHEFHYSQLAGSDVEAAQAYKASGADGKPADTHGFQKRNTLASYAHLHFGSNPAAARVFTEHCRSFKRKGQGL